MKPLDEQRIAESLDILSRHADTDARARELLRQMLREDGDHPGLAERCRRDGLSERRLWNGLVLYRETGSLECPELPWADLTLLSRQKLKRRLPSLIRELPPESLEEFRGLVALTATFLDRVNFVCDLVVYLYAEREKGRWRGHDGCRYSEFFVEKLMWELEVVRRTAEEHPLGQLNEQYASWLCDRILDGEVLI